MDMLLASKLVARFHRELDRVLAMQGDWRAIVNAQRKVEQRYSELFRQAGDYASVPQVTQAQVSVVFMDDENMSVFEHAHPIIKF
jgi:hypothetical protein